MSMNIWQRFLTVLFPERCINCKKEGTLLCPRCLSDRKLAPSHENPHIRGYYSYKDPIIKRALWLLKYKNRQTVADIFSTSLVGLIEEELSDAKIFAPYGPFFVAGIPLSKKRRFSRGYNQSELVAQAIAEKIPDLVLLKNVVQKTKETTPQAKMHNKRERLHNLKNCFQVIDPEKIKNAIIFLVDDVTTTGATLSEVAKVLKKSGAREVYMYAVAH